MLSIARYWQYRELVQNLVAADLKMRYKNSFLGFLWSLLAPLSMSAVLIFVFINVFRFDIPNYSQYLLIGIITYRFFSFTAQSLHAIVGSPSLINKIYFPREILVFSSCLSSLITASIEFVILFFAVTILGTPITPYVLLAPIFLFLEFIFVLGISYFLSSTYVYFRDMVHIWEIVLQVIFYATPIIYPGSLIPDQFNFLVTRLNPLSHFVIAMRYAFMYQSTPSLGTWVGMIGAALISYIIGYAVFKKLEPRFAEEV